MKLVNHKNFANGSVFCLRTESGLVETTDTFLPFYTKSIKSGSNSLLDCDPGSRDDRWMIGVSTMSGCPLRCKFCATGNMKRSKVLSSDEIIDQVMFVLDRNSNDPNFSREFKINYTRMGEPFLNIDAVKTAINKITALCPNTHHYISTIGIKGSDFSWIEGNISLQISLHACNDEKRDFLIPHKSKMSIAELGKIRTKSKLKTTLNLTLVEESDFDIDVLKEYFDPEYFFIKLSPINPNEFSDKNLIGAGAIKAANMI